MSRRGQVVVVGAVVLGQHRHDRATGFRPMRTCRSRRRTDRVVGAPDAGARMSNRSVNTETDYNPIVIDDNSAHC